jgi:YaiO family outer membrane protein
MMRRPAVLSLVGAAWLLTAAVPARAQDVLDAARQAASRADGLAILSAHLGERPRDVDARLLYALLLSWEERYDEARAEFRLVLEEAPAYTDARVGLMNVEWWSGNRRAAREQADLILARDPGQPQARDVRARFDAASRPWQAATVVAFDRFNDGRQPWHEQQVSLTRQTPSGPVIGRFSNARRYGGSDRQFEAEYYPRLRPGTYAFVALAVAPEHTLYPKRRLALDLYQSLGGGVEVSGGYRRLEFASAASIYVATVTKYVSSWMVTAKVYRVPGAGAAADSTSFHGVVRRYFGSDGGSYAGAGFSQGLNREEVRGAGDLSAVDYRTVRGQSELAIAPRLRLQLEASLSRQGTATRAALWQTTGALGLMVRF